MGVGEAKTDRKALEHAQAQLGLIAGQQPVVTRAKKSIAGFKIREGMEIGTKVTLRGDYMYEFLDRLLTIALPRIRDFRGINPNSFDGRGTSPSASGSRSSSRRSTTTQSTRCAVWT